MMYSKLRLLTPLFVLFALSYTCAFAQQPPLKNGGFEGGGGTDGKGEGFRTGRLMSPVMMSIEWCFTQGSKRFVATYLVLKRSEVPLL